MSEIEEQLVPLILDALRNPDRRKEILRDFERALRRYRGRRPEAWWWIFTGLQVDAALYEPDPRRYVDGMVNDEEMEAKLVRAIDDLKTAGFRIDYPP